LNTEDKLIERIARAIPSRIGRTAGDVRLGIGDDAAILKSRTGMEWVVSCDNFIEGVHFLGGIHLPDSVGYKALVRATSDLVAMGARPRIFMLALALPADRTGKWLDGFLRGMARAARFLDVRLIGGDTTTSATTTASVTVFGQVQAGQAVTRSGARPGDRIYVSGALGRAELGLEVLRAWTTRHGRAVSSQPAAFSKLLKPHFYPEIPMQLGLWLARNRIPSAMMDLSDGLSTDLYRLCEASGVGARLWASEIPRVVVPRAASRMVPTKLETLSMALHGGDDYGLLFTVPRRNESKLRYTTASARRRFPGVACTGEIVRLTPELRRGASRVFLLDEEGRVKPLTPRGWDPFRK
jgi:thiamine-monophosphate kinase